MGYPRECSDHPLQPKNTFPYLYLNRKTRTRNIRMKLSFGVSHLIIFNKGSFRIYGLGGRHIPQILISLANDLIYANGFIRVPLFFLRIPKNSKSKIVLPPSA